MPSVDPRIQPAEVMKHLEECGECRERYELARRTRHPDDVRAWREAFWRCYQEPS